MVSDDYDLKSANTIISHSKILIIFNKKLD